MKYISFHLILILFIGYVIGYYWRGLGNMTVGRFIASA